MTDRLDEALRAAQRLAITDPLTGLYNRRFLQETLHLAAALPEHATSPLDLLQAADRALYAAKAADATARAAEQTQPAGTP